MGLYRFASASCHLWIVHIQGYHGHVHCLALVMQKAGVSIPQQALPQDPQIEALAQQVMS